MKFAALAGDQRKSADGPAAAETGKRGAQGAPKTRARNALQTVVSRNNFYKDGYAMLMRVALLEAVAIAGLVVALIAVIMVTDPQDRFFATTEDGKIINLVPLNVPNQSDDAVLTWAANAAVQTMTFGFHDYRQRLQESSTNFTPRGWQSFLEAINRSGTLESVESYRQILTAVPQRAPVMLDKREVAGVYRWVVQFPLLVTTQSGNRTSNSRSILTLVIERVPTIDKPIGLGIEQWLQE